MPYLMRYLDLASPFFSNVVYSAKQKSINLTRSQKRGLFLPPYPAKIVEQTVLH